MNGLGEEKKITITYEMILGKQWIIHDTKLSSYDQSVLMQKQKLMCGVKGIVGTTRELKPCRNTRFVIFSDELNFAKDYLEEDPWQIAGLLKRHHFIVIDKYNHGDVLQVAVLNVPLEEIIALEEVSIEEEVTGFIRRMLVESYSHEPPQKKDGITIYEAIGCNTSSLSPLTESNPNWCENIEGPKRLSIQDSQIQVCEKLEDESKGSIWAIIRPCDPVTQKPKDPEYPLNFYIGEIIEGEVEFVAQSIGGNLYEQSFLSPVWATPENSYALIKVTNKKDWASGNINLRNPWDEYNKIGVWTKSYPSGFKAICEEMHYEDQGTQFSTLWEMMLSLYVHLGKTALEREKYCRESELSEIDSENTPEYRVMRSKASKVHFQASTEEENQHPSLAFLESKATADMLLSTIEREMFFKNAYAGAASDTSNIRAFREEPLWFDPTPSACYPLRLVEAAKQEQELREAYERMRLANPEKVIPKEEFEYRLSMMNAALQGDLPAVEILVNQEVENSGLPYRLEFSYSLNYEEKTLRLNLFLPQRACFPRKGMNKKDFHYPPKHFGEKEFNELYSNFACCLGFVSATVVVNKAPWVRDIYINGLYRGKEEPFCLYSVAAKHEDLLKQPIMNITEASDILIKLKAIIDCNSKHLLNPIEPLFQLEEGMDFVVGFERFENGWTKPFWYIGENDIPENKRIRFINSQITYYLSIREVEYAYTIAMEAEPGINELWLDYINEAKIGFSCKNDFEFHLAQDITNISNVERIDEGLAVFYSLLGVISIEKRDFEQAEEFLDISCRLNPGCANPWLELEYLALQRNDHAKANASLKRAYEVAYTKPQLSRVFRAFGFLCCENEEYETAAALYKLALHKDMTEENLSKCLNELKFIEQRAPDLPVLSLAEIKRKLKGEKYPIHASDRVIKLARMFFEAIEDGDQISGETLYSIYQILSDEDLQEDDKVTFVFLKSGVFGELDLQDYYLRPTIIEHMIDKEQASSCFDALNAKSASFNSIAGIPYIDNSKGLVIDCFALTDFESREIRAKVKKDTRLIIQAVGLEKNQVKVLSEHEVEETNYKEEMEAIFKSCFESSEREITRGLTGVNRLRQFGSPDDILVILRKQGEEPEGVWMKLEKYSEDSRLSGMLLNEPYSDFGLHVGDNHEILLSMIEGGVIAEIDFG